MLFCRRVMALVLLLASPGAFANVPLVKIDSDRVPVRGYDMLVIEEAGPAPWSLYQAEVAVKASGPGQLGVSRVINRGIGADPVWLYARLNNDTGAPMRRYLLIGTPWSDLLDVYLLNGQTREHRIAGDGDPGRLRPSPGNGYLVPVTLGPGVNELYLRADIDDPMVLPVEVLAPAAAQALTRRTGFSYGLIYGFLLALIAYNTMLFMGMRTRLHREYALYLACFVLANMGYSGHGYVWFWGQYSHLQQYLTLGGMVLFALAGFRFGRTFLNMRRYFPALDRQITAFSWLAFMLLVASVLADAQSWAALTAFVSVSLYSVSMVVIGVLALLRQVRAARLFMLAATFGLVGTTITAFGAWGIIPYTELGQRAVEIGLALEAILFALAVADQVKGHEQARRSAEQIAAQDSLTGLLNRRAMREQGGALFRRCLDERQPVSLVMLDLDDFSVLVGQLGRKTADAMLQELANILGGVCRGDDLVCRWGGGEFVLLLPHTDRDEANLLAERIRQRLSRVRLHGGDGSMRAMSASVVVLAEVPAGDEDVTPVYGSLRDMIDTGAELLEQRRQQPSREGESSGQAACAADSRAEGKS